MSKNPFKINIIEAKQTQSNPITNLNVIILYKMHIKCLTQYLTLFADFFCLFEMTKVMI